MVIDAVMYRQVSYISVMNEFVDAIQPRKTEGQYIKHNLHNMMHFNYDLIEQFGPCLYSPHAPPILPLPPGCSTHDDDFGRNDV